MSLILANKNKSNSHDPLCESERLDGLRRASMFKTLCKNHERISKDNDVRMVKYAFLIMRNDKSQGQDYAGLLKSLMRLYLNRYRRRHSGKRVLGYSWILNIESSTGLPYLHVIFYVSKETYDTCLDEEFIPEAGRILSELFYVPYENWDKPESTEDDVNDIKDLGYYWMVVCESEGITGAVVSYNHDKGRYILSHGKHPYLKHLKDTPLLTDLNGSSVFLSKINAGSGQNDNGLSYFKILAREAFLTSGERSYGVSHKRVKQVSENERLTIPEKGTGNGIKKLLNDDL